MAGSGSPWEWHLHLGGYLVAIALGAAYVTALRRLGGSHGAGSRPGPSIDQALRFGSALVVLAAATTWPMADLARHWSLLGHMAQTSLLVLVVPPLLLTGMPRWLIEVATRPPRVDALMRALARPGVAVVVFNAVVVASLVPAVVNLEARSAATTAAFLALLLAAGIVLWVPALRTLPGPPHLSTAGRVGYLFLQSVLPNIPSVIFIFASHPIYAVFAAHARAIGISAHVDQQLAGALAKLLGITVLWGAAAVVLVRAQRAEDEGRDPDPLTWDDVERELRRLDRPPRRTDAS